MSLWKDLGSEHEQGARWWVGWVTSGRSRAPRAPTFYGGHKYGAVSGAKLRFPPPRCPLPPSPRTLRFLYEFNRVNS